MKQMSLAHCGFDGVAKRTRKWEFLDDMGQVVPWAELSLRPERPSQPIFVTNADLQTKENYGYMLDPHINADAAMGACEYEMQVPFSVVRERDGRIEAIEERPIQRFTASSGVCVLSPSALDLVSRNQFFDVPSSFEVMVAKGMRTRCHRINGYWLDTGRLTDYGRANLEFDEEFR